MHFTRTANASLTFICWLNCQFAGRTSTWKLTWSGWFRLVHLSARIYNTATLPTTAGTWHKTDPAITHVHVVYMSHLDVGFTRDTSLEVLDEYFSTWFPLAFNVSAELRARGGEEQFGWTTHAWLVDRYLVSRNFLFSPSF